MCITQTVRCKMYQGYEELLVEKHGKILVIKFNKPDKKNCVNRNAYVELSRTMRAAAQDESIVIVVFTGVGEYFTAGNDLTQSADVTDMEAYLRRNTEIFKEMASSVIDCPKVTIALVNGPAIGVGATLAVACDMAWCADTAYFLTPFTKLGLVPEACSSYLFPLVMGRSKTTEMLLFGEKLSAEEAYKFNLVSRVFKLSELNSTIWPKIKEYSELPPGSMMISKKLLRSAERDVMYRTLNAECDELYKRFFTEEFMNAILQFSMRKTKSKM